MTDKRTIFFTGIGGIGMSALAQLLTERGDSVSGSDREESPITEMLIGKGIEVYIGQKEEHIFEGIDLLVYSDAVPENNPERARARALGITELSYFEMLGTVSATKRTVAVAGTHGKTTTTGMLTKILSDANTHPQAIIGSIVRDFGSNYLSSGESESDVFIVEACEWKRHFLSLSPEMLVITNLEFDHTDYFDDLADVQNAFASLIAKVPSHGAIITDTEHPAIAPLLQKTEARIIDYMKEPVYPLTLKGEFNEMNARAAAAAAKTILPTITMTALNRSLESFTGTWRRFEYKGVTKTGAKVYDDYAHHPTAIMETVRALKPEVTGKLYVAFHPHLYSRTRDLFDGFVRAFRLADEVLIAPIYGAREIDDGSVSSELLAEAMQAVGTHARAFSFEDIEAVLIREPKEGDVIMTMGAGDIYKIADRITTH